MGNNINGDRNGFNNVNNGSGNSGGGLNLSNLFDLGKIGNLLGLGGGNSNRSGGGMSNPLSAIGKLFNGGGQNRQRQYRSPVKVIPIEEAYRVIKSGNCFLLDIRTEMEYNTIRIKGSVNIPLDKLQADIQNIVTNKAECIIVYCATGSRVRRAVQILWSLGYTNICIWEGAGINTFAFADLIVYNDSRNKGEEKPTNSGGIY